MTFDPFFTQRPSGGESRQPSLRMSTGQLGMLVFLASLGMVFAASLVAYFITRYQSAVWRPPGAPGLPPGLWVSTVTMVLVSVALEYAKRCVKHNRLASLSRALLASAALAVLFLVAQALNWRQLAVAQIAPPVSLYGFTFYLLTGLHALHIVGGLVPLGIVWARARAREYSSSRYEGLRFCVQYWHFLGVVWLVLLATLELWS